jgi:hypothetical protein
MVLTSYQACAYPYQARWNAQWTPNPTSTYQAQRNRLTTTRQPTLHRPLEQGGTVRALYMAITKTKPSHDSSHTISSSNNIKPRQMICSKAHDQGDAHKTPKWIIAQKDPKPPSITFANLYRARQSSRCCGRTTGGSNCTGQQFETTMESKWSTWDGETPNPTLSHPIPNIPTMLLPPQTNKRWTHNPDTSSANWHTSTRTKKTSPSKMTHTMSIIWKRRIMILTNLQKEVTTSNTPNR